MNKYDITLNVIVDGSLNKYSRITAIEVLVDKMLSKRNVDNFSLSLDRLTLVEADNDIMDFLEPYINHLNYKAPGIKHPLVNSRLPKTAKHVNLVQLFSSDV